MIKKENAIPKSRMHTTHSNILEQVLDFFCTSLQVMTDDWKKKSNVQNVVILTIVQSS